MDFLDADAAMVLQASTEDILARTRLLENDIRVMSSELKRLMHEQAHMQDKVKENLEKIRNNKQLPHLVGNVIEVLDASDDGLKNDGPFENAKDLKSKHTTDKNEHNSNEDGEEEEEEEEEENNGDIDDVFDIDVESRNREAIKKSSAKAAVKPRENNLQDGASLDYSMKTTGMCAVIKTSTRQTIFLPMVGLVSPSELRPGDLVGLNKDSYLILDKLPPEYDARVKAMEVDERPTEDYSDVGGLDKQIEELVEAIVLPLTHRDRFERLGIKPPKGVLMYGPPGTGKTLLARACAAQTQSTFLKLAGPQLVQMFIGDGAKLVRDAFALAREKQPAIIFIDELDAIGTKRFDSEKSGDREVQRTMLELLNQLDGFQPSDNIRVIAATNRIDILDPALLRSGRIDRKIEFPHPNEEARARIMQIHSRKMNINSDVNFAELARCCDEFNGAQCKAVCVEAGMIALRRGALCISHEDYMEGIQEVQAKKKTVLQYYA